MAGTKEGGKHAAATNKKKYGPDFYAKIGAKGGRKGRTGGFFANRELARVAGSVGGQISRRGDSKLSKKDRERIKAEAYASLKRIHDLAVRERNIEYAA